MGIQTFSYLTLPQHPRHMLALDLHMHAANQILISDAAFEFL